MFEDNLVESQVTPISSTKRWTMAGSTLLQAAIAVTLIVIPLLHPERLTFHPDTPLVFTPPPPRPPLQVQQVRRAASNDALSAEIPVPSHPLILISRDPAPLGDPPPNFGQFRMGVGSDTGIPSSLIGSTGSGTRVSVATRPPERPLHVSTGVSAGMLLSPVRPVYPGIAKAAGVSGVVVIEAVISKAGAIQSLQVVSGPPMLREAALDAIRAARYRPYLLNGEPTEVQTTFTVNFKLGS